MTIELTYDAVLDAAREIVSEKGWDYVYTPANGNRGRGMSCSNWHPSESGEKVPGCIVGTILYRLGVSLNDMVSNSDAASLTESLTGRDIISVSDWRVDSFLAMAQIAQDNGATWYSAAEVARYHVMKLGNEKYTASRLKRELMKSNKSE